MRINAAALVLVIALSASSAPGQQQLLWSNPANGSTTSNPSQLIADGPAAGDTEVADDFEAVGEVERLVVAGNGCFQCTPPELLGVWVRFWAWTANGPGALQDEQFLAAGEPGLLYDVAMPDGLDITLPTPFTATGAHFVSVQAVFSSDGGWWTWWLANEHQPQGSAIAFRDAAEGGEWGPHVDFFGQTTLADTAFSLYGTTSDAPPDLVAGCGVWRALPTPSPEGAHHAVLRDVAVNGDEAWAVGDYSAAIAGNVDTFTLVQRWDGQRWQIVPSPSPSPAPGLTSSALEAVAVLDDGQVWAAGTTRRQDAMGYVGNHVLVLRRDGDAWTELATPVTTQCSGSFIYGMKLFSAEDGWFVGESCPLDGIGAQLGALAMHWDGSQWSYPPLPDPYGAAYGLEAVDGVAPDDLWAVGGGPDGDWVGYSYVIRWDGSSWSHVPLELPEGHFGARLFSVTALAADDVWIAGQIQIDTTIQPLVAHWDGATLQLVDAPAGGADFLSLGERGLLAVGSGGVALWDGSSWTLEPTVGGVPGATMGALAATGACSGWGVGRQLVAGDLLALVVQLSEVQARLVDEVLFADDFESGDVSRWN